VEIARQIEAARALGDLSENGDYHAAKDARQDGVRVRQLQRMLGDAVIVDSSTHEAGVVTAGVVVELRYEGDEETERFFVGSIEEKAKACRSFRPLHRSARRSSGTTSARRSSTTLRTTASLPSRSSPWATESG